MRNYHLLLATLFVSSASGCSTCKRDAAPEPAQAAAPSASAATAKAAKGASEGTPEAAGGAGGAGAVVFKSHELPAPSKPIAGFKPKSSGFKFQNYGNPPGVVNLTVTELRRMFGDQVCGSLEGDKCILTPAAQQWLESSNKGMSGGHCEGFAALTLLMERGQINPKLFGADTAPDLELAHNEKLQREIAYWFITQGVLPMARAEVKSLTPSEIVEKLEESLKGGAETYTLGIYAPGYKMGHATTPYAVVDKGEEVVWIMHYDNNYPGEEKHIEVDKKANTWKYTTAADPEAAEHAYVGDAETKTLTIAPTSVRTGPLICHFCGAVDVDAESDKGSKGAVAGEFREIAVDGDADLLITDDSGHRLGYVDGKLVNEIKGAFFAADKSGDDAHDDEPSFFVPSGHKLKVTLDGTSLKKPEPADVSLFGRGYTLAVEGVSLAPGQKDEIDFAADWSVVTYTTKQAETPTLVIGIETSGADYEFEVKVSGENAGQTVELSIDLKKGTFGVKLKGDPAAKPTLSATLTKIEKGGEQTFTHKGIAVAGDHVLSFNYASWKGNKTPLHLTTMDAKGAVVSEEDEADED